MTEMKLVPESNEPSNWTVLDKIKALNEELGPLSNQLNICIQNEEARLVESGASVRAEVKLVDNAFLLWTRYGATWRIMVRYEPDPKIECLQNSREIRILALEQIGQLQVAILNAQKSLKTRIERVLE